MTLLERFLMWLPCFGTHTIYDGQGDAYLLRKYLLPKRFTGAWWPGVFLHKFYQSDSDRCPHNHPWRWAVSLILTGGYREDRFVNANGEAHKKAEPGKEWGFIDPDTGVFTGWKAYLPAGADGLEGD